ncbi:MAG: polyprenyl synthetase family protein [Patescibacteria group bacterium]
MQFQQQLKICQQEINKIIENFFVKKEKEFLDLPKLKEIIFDLHQICAGGKRLRGFLTKISYDSFGGERSSDILNFSAGVELLHSALLIHDDIIDRDAFRRMNPTLHKKYEKFYPLSTSKEIAQSAANLLSTFGSQLCLETNFSAQRKILALSYLRQKLFHTALGEILDIHFSGRKSLGDSEIFKIYTLKTAGYTIVAPFFCGAILAGAPPSKINFIKSSLVKLGQAFQIKDDLLAVFGVETATGKPLGSDLKEGKMTLVFKRMEKFVPKAVRKKVFSLFGKENLTRVQALEIKNLLLASQLNEKVEQEAKNLVKSAKKIFLEFPSQKKKLFLALADFIVKRKE